MQRVNVVLSDDLLTRIDKLAQERNISRSRCIADCMIDYLAAIEKADSLKSQFADYGTALAQYMKGEITEEEYRAKIAAIAV